MYYLFNVDFDAELSSQSRAHLLYWQLQFLPLAFFSKHDRIIAHNPIKHPQIISSDELVTSNDISDIEVWGITPSTHAFIKKWLPSKKVPSADLVRRLNSKEYSHSLSPLPGSILIHTLDDLIEYSLSVRSQSVLKLMHGFSGRGHFFDRDLWPKIAQKAFSRKEAVLIEPWVERIFDFSTQWYIKECGEIIFLGALSLYNSPKGAFESVSTKIPQYYTHYIDQIYPYVKHLSSVGFIGNVGIDSFLYKNGDTVAFQPICEINPRKTFGWVALEIAKNLCRPIHLSYIDKTCSILPTISPEGIRCGKGLEIKYLI